jgi:hypothetical protein
VFKKSEGIHWDKGAAFMAQMVFFKPRIWTLEETTDGPRVVIPSPCLWPLAIFLGVWLCGWMAGEVSAAKSLWQLARTSDTWLALLPGAFLLFWLSGWTMAGIFIWGAFLFSIQGREVVSLHGDRLRIRLETLVGLGWSWHFSLPEMAPPQLIAIPLQKNKDLDDTRLAGAMLPNYSGVVIRSGSKSWRLGLGVDEPGARDLLHTLTVRFGLGVTHLSHY